MLIDQGTYHVLTRGNNGQPVFHDEIDYQRYLQLLAAYIRKYHLKLYHFALMPNHVHLVLEVPVGDALSKTMSGVNLRYSLYYRRRYQYHGHLWQGRFKSLLIERDSYLLACGRYVELNPVRANLVGAPGAYVWSSYRVYADGAENPLVAPNPLYEALGATIDERQRAYRQFVLDGLQQQTPQPAASRYGLLEELAPAPECLWEPFRFSSVGRKRGRPRKIHAPIEK